MAGGKAVERGREVKGMKRESSGVTKYGRGAGIGAGSSNAIEFTRPLPVPGEARNYTVLNLDEPATAAQLSWRSTVRQFRLWCYNTSPDRFCFGDEKRRSCMLPVSGHFLVYIHYHKEWMCAIIDGPSGYLDGYITRSEGKDTKIQENGTKLSKGLKKEVTKQLLKQLPIYIEGAKMLPWSGSYVHAADCLLGYMGLINSFRKMYRRMEGIEPLPDDDEVIKAGETFILHLSEAGRSDKLYHKVDKNFICGEKLGPDPLEDAQNWSYRCKKAFVVMVDKTPKKWAAKKGGKTAAHEPRSFSKNDFGPEIKEEIEIIEDIRLFYRKAPCHGKFKLANMPVHLGWQGPVNSNLERYLKRGAQEHPESMFLIQPFLPFNCSNNRNVISENGELNQNLDSGVSNKPQILSDEVAEDPTILENTSEENIIDEWEVPYYVVSEEALKAFEDKAHEDQGCAGIYNLGQTCFASSIVQYFNCVPELKEILARYTNCGRSEWIDQESYNLTAALHEILEKLDHSIEPISPIHFIKALGERHQPFKERHGSIYRQQDVAECRSLLLSTLSGTLGMEASGSASDPIKALFGIELMSRLQRAEDDEEHTKRELVYHLNCSITDDIDHLEEGLEHDLQIEDAIINELPIYLNIEFQRVDHDERGQPIKNLRNVDYPLELNVNGLCSEELKYMLQANKERSWTVGESSSMDADKADSYEPMVKLTGIYDLIAVVTHEGQTANSGHYVILVKQDDNKWIQFDDDKKSVWREEEVLRLSGGGDSKMAYICLYKARVG